MRKEAARNGKRLATASAFAKQRESA